MRTSVEWVAYLCCATQSNGGKEKILYRKSILKENTHRGRLFGTNKGGLGPSFFVCDVQADTSKGITMALTYWETFLFNIVCITVIIIYMKYDPTTNHIRLMWLQCSSFAQWTKILCANIYVDICRRRNAHGRLKWPPLYALRFNTVLSRRHTYQSYTYLLVIHNRIGLLLFRSGGMPHVLPAIVEPVCDSCNV